jgi:hypothetical protein
MVKDPKLRCATAVWAVLMLALPVLAPAPLVAQDAAPTTGAADDWVARSNENAKVLLEIQAKYGPEGASRAGVDGLEEEVFQISEERDEQAEADVRAALVTLRSRLAAETHPAVRQDLEIMIEAAEDGLRGNDLEEEYYLPYFNLSQTIFGGIRALLDDQIPAERRPAAVVRLRKYTGMEEGYAPLTEQATAYTRAYLDDPSLRGPFKDDLEKDLSNSARFIEGLAQLFQRYELEGWEEPYELLRTQLAEYETFLREEMLPRASEDFRLPPEVYAYSLDQFGIDMPVPELTSRAKVAFREIQNEMQALAALIAERDDLPSADYRDVLRHLKEDQLVGEEILAHYEKTIAALEERITEAGVVTLPERDMRIRLATEAEAAQTPAPNMRPPRLIGNTGEMGEFVLPLRIPGKDGEEIGFDDFTYEAAAWTLTVHEGRPGHELQFASIIERGVSQARILYAMNSVNVEGWALYAEAEMKPLLPLEGQLVSLQHRLLRAARAYLDPGLQLGEISREEATRILEQEVVLSPAMALQEVERYTFMAPGQAPSYFCGYSRLMELRTDAERLMGDRFDRKAFHDFVLAQGLLPPSLLRQAVMDGLVMQAGATAP